MDPHAPRAPRVPVDLSIMYRRTHDDHWFQAKTVNLSESGLLFGPTNLEPGTTVEIILSPSMPIAGFPTGRQVCQAQVVRATAVGAVAVRFEECRFLLES